MAENRFQKYIQPPQGTTFATNPNEARDQSREDERLRNEQERLRLAQENAARDAANDAITQREKADKLTAEQEERARLQAAQASGVSDALATMRRVIGAARDAKTMAASGAGIGSYEGTQGFRDSSVWSILGANSASNDMQALLNTIGSNTAFDRLQKMREESPTGGALGAVSEVELRLLRDSIASLSQTQSDAQFRSNMDKIIEAYTRIAGKLQSADSYYRQNGTMAGYVPPSEEELAGFAIDQSTPADPVAAGSGATQTSIPIPQEYQDRHLAYLRQNWGNLTPEGYAQFRAGLDNEYPEVGSPNLEAYRNVVGDLNAMAAEGQPPEAAGAVPANARDLSGFDQLRNNIATDPLGTFAANALDIGGAANWLADGRVQASSELNPTAAFFGDMVSGTTGAGMTGMALSASSKLAPKAMFLGDALYGGVDGAMSDDNAIAGFLTGVTSAAVGDQAGKYIGRGIGQFRAGGNPLTDGQQAVAQTVRGARDTAEQDIVDALTQARDLGVPMTLADASPELGSLAGSAVRFSPTTAGTARSVMAQRNQGQLDRLAEAVERDLGPVTNIPQRSEDLLQQARAQAAPLYDAAYAAPGAELVDIADLAERPTFAAALREGYTEMLDEGLDPSAVGLQQAGENIMIAAPSWQALDYTKRGLDNIIERGIKQGDGPAVRRATSMKNMLLSRMDEANPAYREARRAYAGPAAERAMLDEGVNAYRVRPDQLSVDMADLSPEQTAQMRLGYQSEVMGQAGNLRNNSNPWAQLNTPNTEGRLEVLYDGAEDADIARLLGQRDLELQLAGSANRLIGNSATAEREIADEFFKQQPGIGGDLAAGIIETGALGGPFLTVGKSIGDRIFRERRERSALEANRRLADEIGPLLLEQSPPIAIDEFTAMMAEDKRFTDELARLLAQGETWGRRAGTGFATATADRTAY
ncbi:hypothetical protein [Qipengyuania sp. MTN3-11]|uniref:hypothetical protein n=1 Tax=Qipengyuania sp. MTN3-11 TaxID=3056557 RepID=UPI0036F30E0F